MIQHHCKTDFWIANLQRAGFFSFRGPKPGFSPPSPHNCGMKGGFRFVKRYFLLCLVGPAGVFSASKTSKLTVLLPWSTSGKVTVAWLILSLFASI